MAILVKILIALSLIILLIPTMVWIYSNSQKARGEISWRVTRVHKWSWIICVPLGILILTIALLLLLV